MISTEESWTTWLCDLEEEDYSFINGITAAPNNYSNSQMSNNDNERPSKLLKSTTPTPRRRRTTGSAGTGRSPQHAHDHIIAERMRREKISQQFIALSALIPGLKKMDKATVLGDAIKYVKQLQEQVKVLETESKRKSAESVVYVEKSEVCGEEDVSVSDTWSNSGGDGNSSYEVSKAVSRSVLPEVEARVSEKNVLIRIHCEKHKGVLMHILKLIDKLHLSVLNTTSLPFGTSIVDITITAEMDEKFSLSAKELARNIRVGVLQSM
ncbi:transcription factor NAI1-like [Arachis stenosperma]|uniref:transcription factor NAI1-like n=1 Tax=Arachis stenosperma TaxID=217475 RepID=UPI0025AD3BDB|nr:transcription factor NAI1-like [Arachis stenosperma]